MDDLADGIAAGGEYQQGGQQGQGQGDQFHTAHTDGTPSVRPHSRRRLTMKYADDVGERGQDPADGVGDVEYPQIVVSGENGIDPHHTEAAGADESDDHGHDRAAHPGG